MSAVNAVLVCYRNFAIYLITPTSDCWWKVVAIRFWLETEFAGYAKFHD